MATRSLYSEPSAQPRVSSVPSRHRSTPARAVGAPEAVESTRERILNSAARLFAEQGFDSVSMPEIANASGITAGAIYKHFSSKADLLLEVVKGAIQSIPLLAQATDGIKDARDLPVFAAAYTKPALKLLRQLTIEVHSATAKDRKVKKLVSQSNERAIKRMSESIAAAQTSGKLDPSLNPDFVASAVGVFVMGLTHMETFLPHLVGDKDWHDFVCSGVAKLMGIR